VAGGAPYNFARALALQAIAASYANPLSDDAFGVLLRNGLAAAGVLTLTMAAGLIDQQVNGANPRLYDFQGALTAVHEIDAEPGAGRPMLLYEPSYLADVISYYAPDIDARPLGSPIPHGTGIVWVLATDRVLGAEDSSAKVGSVLADLQQTRQLVDTINRPNVRVWELR